MALPTSGLLLLLLSAAGTTTVSAGPALRADGALRTPLRVEGFETYPGYTVGLTVAGNMSIEQGGIGAQASQILSFSLQGADPACGTANISGVPNACSISIHEGTNCTDAVTIGGHLFAANLDSDPWKPVIYSVSGGVATGEIARVGTGLTNKDLLGRTMVVHDATGARMACGQVVEDMPAPLSIPHEGVHVQTMGTILPAIWAVVGLFKACAGNPGI